MLAILKIGEIFKHHFSSINASSHSFFHSHESPLIDLGILLEGDLVQEYYDGLAPQDDLPAMHVTHPSF
jgi:hypothetical protein